MSGNSANREMLQQLFTSAGLTLSPEDLAVVSELHASFAGQRARLVGSARLETEPMTIPAFERVYQEKEADDERDS